MRLLDPSPGEILDRSSILILKIEAAEIKKLSASHFFSELNELSTIMLQKLDDEIINSEFEVEAYKKANADLQIVNKRLWNYEDEVRALPRVSDSTPDQIFRAAQLRELITDLNDCRADLVARLNSFFGIIEQEKIYQCTQR